MVSLLTQLCGGLDRKVYLYSGGEGVREVDKQATNTILAKAGVVLKSRQTASERTVAVTVEPGHVVGHHLFWLAKIPAAGVVVEAAEDLAAPEG